MLSSNIDKAMKSVQFFVIRSQTFFPLESGLSAYHSSLFHGYTDPLARMREGRSPSNIPRPLQLIFNLASHASVIKPHHNLLLRASAFENEPALRQCKLLTVNITKFVNLPFAKEDMSYFDSPDETEGDYPALLRQAKAVKSPPEFAPQFMELYAQTTAGAFISKEVRVVFDYGEVRNISVCPGMLKDAGVYHSDGCIVLGESLAQVVLPRIDSDYFEVRSVQIAQGDAD